MKIIRYISASPPKPASQPRVFFEQLYQAFDNETTSIRRNAHTSLDMEILSPTTPLSLRYKLSDSVRARYVEGKKKAKQPVFWQLDWYRDDSGQEVSVLVADNLAASEALAQRFAQERVVGFDLEWKPVFKKGGKGRSIQENLSLVQLARDGEVGLFHIGQHAGKTAQQLFAPTLIEILTKPSIVKAGVAVHHEDKRRLQQFAGIEPQGLLELSHIHHALIASTTASERTSKELVSLSRQTEMYLGHPLQKGKIRSSNWAHPLNGHQIRYPAADAYVGLLLYHTINNQRLSLVSGGLSQSVDRPASFEVVIEVLDLTASSPPREDRSSFMRDVEHSTHVDEASVDAIAQSGIAKQRTFSVAPSRTEMKNKTLRSSTSSEADAMPRISYHWSQKDTRKQVRMVPNANPILRKVCTRSQSRCGDSAMNSNGLPPNKRSYDIAMNGGAATATQHIERTSNSVHKKQRNAVNETEKSMGNNEGQDKDHLLQMLERLVPAIKELTSESAPREITKNTLCLIASTKPSSIPDLCKIPGAISLLQFCKTGGVNLLDWIQERASELS